MKYTDLIFDLYGTLVDIHTEENELVWEKTALYFGYYGAHYTPEELHLAFDREMKSRQAKAGQSYECFPDLPVEPVMAKLFRDAGVEENAEELGVHAAQLFRICSTEYIRLYPGALEALEKLRAAGCRLWLLSNAQRVFTAYELRHLGVSHQLDGIFLSSDFGCRKPDSRFYQALIRDKGLDIRTCLMIGNDRDTDIAGAKALGMDTLYMHTALTPSQQAPADHSLHPACSQGPHYEYEGDNWQELGELILSISTR